VSGARISAVLAATVCAAVLAFPAAAGPDAPARKGEVAIFYYPWYSTPVKDGGWAHWYLGRGEAAVLATTYYPTRGLYSSSSARIVDAHMREIAAAGVHTAIVSWWGPTSPEAGRLALVAKAARRHGLAVAIHLEPYVGRTPASTADDLNRLREAGYTEFYVYDADREPASKWSEELARLDPKLRIFGHTTLVGRAKTSGFDGIYTYDVGIWNGSTFGRICAQAHKVGLLCAPSVGPGYDARLATQHALVRPRLDGWTYDHMWKKAVTARADVVTITSYNEWQEGTQIEPAQAQVDRLGYDGAWGRSGVAAQRAYLEATARWAARFLALLG
jgi:glycoprotein endo-alpha-1,2-mannosidase